MNKPAFQIGLTVLSCILVLSFPVYTTFWVYPHFTELITFEKEVNAKQIAKHITKMLDLENKDKTLSQESVTDNFVRILQEARSDFDLTKVKIFSPGGEVLYSSDSREIGNVNTNPYFTDIVAEGKIFSMVVQKEDKTMEEVITPKDVVETYVPLLSNQRFIGALEVYYDITYAEYSVSKFITKSKTLMLLLTVFLLICILLLAYSGVLYHRTLRKQEEKMQKLMDNMPPMFKESFDRIDK